MLRALIVEDNDHYREAFKETLLEHFPSIGVEEAGSAEEALEKIGKLSPDLIFMDIRLPGTNGLQLTRRIKKDLPHIRVAIVTSYDLPEYQKAAMDYGADLFFVKDLLNWDQVETFVKSIQDGKA